MSVQNYPKAFVEAPSDLPTITITRDFAGTVEQVRRAHLDPELFVRWVGPGEAGRVTVDHWDARRGGSWRYLYDDGSGEVQGFYGSFHDVGDNRIVQTFTWEPMPESVSLETLVLTPLEGGGTRLQAVSVMGSMQARDGMLNSGMEAGVEAGYGKLDSLLASS